MALSLFGIAAADVRKHHFPYWSDFSVNSSPTLATCTELIDDCAGELAGKLLGESIDAADVLALGATAAPYVSCRRQLRKMAALAILLSSTSQDPDVAKKWQKEIDAWFDGLLKGGATFLGDTTLTTAASNPDGPTSHISEYGLDIGTPATDASDVIPPFRKSDIL